MSEKRLWNQIKNTLQKKFQGKLLSSVLNSVTLESFNVHGEKHLRIKVPSAFHQDVLKKHLSHIQTYIRKQGSPHKTVHIQKAHFDSLSLKPMPTHKVSLTKSLSPSVPFQKRNVFSSKWTFSSFIEGPNNCFAFSLAKSVAKHPCKNNANPLFIHGDSGLGKTHLLHAIGHFLEKEAPLMKVFYLPAERFFNDCISHIRKNEMPAFRQKYRQNIHVLLLDDVQILGRGESTQEEFFHTFENLKQNGCQIVLASDQKPAHIKGLKSRIKTRFEGGIIADIQAPDKDTKTAIIKNKAETVSLSLSEEIISYLASLPTNSVRETEGHLNKIKMFCELQKKRPSLFLAQELFSEEPSPYSLIQKGSHSVYKRKPGYLPPKSGPSSPPFSSKPLKIKDIQKHICFRFHLSLSDLKSSSRLKYIVQARNWAIYITRKELNLSLAEIGYYFGNRNHSTVSNSLKKVEIQIQKNTKIRKDIQELRNFIHKTDF